MKNECCIIWHEENGAYNDNYNKAFSILQMPAGVPVATVALNGAKNAAILALQIVSAMDVSIQNKIIQYKQELKKQVLSKSKIIKV